jgi:hypothetical protein
MPRQADRYEREGVGIKKKQVKVLEGKGCIKKFKKRSRNQSDLFRQR